MNKLLLGVFLVIGPVSSRKYFDSQVDSERVVRGPLLELMTQLLRHLHVFKHDFEFLSELEAALFFQLQHERLLRIVADSALLQQALSKTIFVE